MRPHHGALWATQWVAIVATMLFASSLFPSSATAQAKGASQGLAETTPQSPCDDPQYLELKKKPLNDMSQREYEYFQQKEKDCTEYRKMLLLKSDQPTVTAPPATSQGTVANAPTVQNHGMGAGAIIAISILGTIGFLLVLGALASGGS